MPAKTNQFRLALLGPEKTFSDQFADSVGLADCIKEYCLSIGSVFKKLESSKDFIGILPLENLLNGSVTSTLDGLGQIARNSLELGAKKDSTDLEIVFTSNLKIDLSLGIPFASEFAISEIEEIYSHEQALGQAEQFIIKNCPKASLRPTQSTAAGIESAKLSKKKAAAIASPQALSSLNFKIISETLNLELSNQTRFAIIARKEFRPEVLNLVHKPFISRPEATFICLDPKMDRQGLLVEILGIISEKHGCNLLSINSRPDKSGGFLFYLELEGGRTDPGISNCLNDVEEYCKAVTGNAASCHVLGSYARTPFFEDLITSACVIGAKGKMGQWFVKFFKEKGISVLELDKDSIDEDKKKVCECSLVIISTPLEALESAVKEVLPYLRKGSLVAENCSVKSQSATILESLLPLEVEILSFHTMFGPDEMTLKGRNIIFAKSDRAGALADSLERLFYKYGAIITHVSITEHDRFVAFTQAAVHFISLGFAELLNNQTLSKKTLEPFMTPNMERLYGNMIRTLSQTPELSELILSGNQFSKEVRDKLILAFEEMNKTIDSKKLGKKVDELKIYYQKNH